jgi:hypothetical protein
MRVILARVAGFLLKHAVNTLQTTLFDLKTQKNHRARKPT